MWKIFRKCLCVWNVMLILNITHHSTSHSHHHIYILIIPYAIWNHTNNIIFMCFYFFPFFVFSSTFSVFLFFNIIVGNFLMSFYFGIFFPFFCFIIIEQIWYDNTTNNQRNPRTYKNECISMYDCMNMRKYGKNGDERIHGGKYLGQWGKMRKFLIHLLKS